MVRSREDMSYLIEVRGLKLSRHTSVHNREESYLIEVRGLKLISIIGGAHNMGSYLIEVRGLKLRCRWQPKVMLPSYLIEVRGLKLGLACTVRRQYRVVSYRGTWVETSITFSHSFFISSRIL